MLADDPAHGGTAGAARAPREATGALPRGRAVISSDAHARAIPRRPRLGAVRPAGHRPRLQHPCIEILDEATERILVLDAGSGIVGVGRVDRCDRRTGAMCRSS